MAIKHDVGDARDGAADIVGELHRNMLALVADGLTYVDIAERIGLSRAFVATEIVAAHLTSMTDAARLRATCHDLPDKEQRWISPSARPTS
jgi:cyanate lyase